jgi:DNA invertase Pin-like site-specific DNA recombinase
MLHVTRSDHGAAHSGKFAAYVRVSTDKQDVVNQEHAIKAYLNGGDYKVKWFREEGVSATTDWHQRHELHACLDHCRKTGATMVIYSVSRLSRRTWETLRFLEQEVRTGKVKLVVVDNPNLDHTTIGLLSAVAEMERTQISERTKASLARINEVIKKKGSYKTKTGKTITKLGAGEKLKAAQKLGDTAKIAAADERANDVASLLTNLMAQGLSYRGIARELNKMGVEPPSRRRNPNLSKKTEWHASTVRNYCLRIGKNK